jgi:hypothetical protein
MPAPRLLAILRRFLRPAEGGDVPPQPEETPQVQDTSPPPAHVDPAIKEPLPQQREEPLMVPDQALMHSLMEKARHEAIKEEPPAEPPRIRYRRLVREQVDAVFLDDSVEEKYLYLKAMVIEGLGELINYHAQCAISYGQDGDQELVASWRRDEGVLSAARELIRTIVVSQADWMARDHH